MPSRLQRKTKRRAKLHAWVESHQTHSTYARKKFERENGRPPDPQAHAAAKRSIPAAKTKS